MDRFDKHVVDLAVMVASRPDSAVGGNAAYILAIEVTALREDYADLERRSLAALEQMAVDAASAITGTGINADLAEQYAKQREELAEALQRCEDWRTANTAQADSLVKLRATVARVEALPNVWRDRANHDLAYMLRESSGDEETRWRDVELGLDYADCRCADDLERALLERALRGEP